MERQLEVKGSGDDQSSSCCYELREEDQHESSVKWMSSKMRILRKFMCSDQNTVRKIRRRRRRRRRRRHQQIQDDQKKKGNRDQSNCGSSDTGGISRVCSDCSTTKTPLWRSGPLGPKSLCNACGIKRRKARKAVSAAIVSGKLQPVVTIKPRRNQALKVDCSVPFKKRCRFIATAEQTAQRKKLSFEDIAISLNKSLSALNRVFPQDEKDAAVLLMALSCGIVCSL